jgi:hypothetical protein
MIDLLGTFVLWHWPHFLEPVSQLWWPESGRLYAFTSSVGSTFAWPLWGFAAGGLGLKFYRKHFECHVDGCKKHGYVVGGGPYRACHEHHPNTEHEDGEPITADHIQKSYDKFMSAAVSRVERQKLTPVGKES